MDKLPSPEPMSIAVRAYAVTTEDKPRAGDKSKATKLEPSEYVLVFDTETNVDSAQQLRFGSYQVRKSGQLQTQGLFYDSLSLSDKDRSLLYRYADKHNLDVLTTEEFIEDIFCPYIYELRGTCVGLNLPFDISRLAIYHSSARGDMRGGFTFQLSNNPERPNIQIKHINSRTALIRFAGARGQKTPRGMRRQGQRIPTRRGYFVDIRTLAGALLGGSWSLERLAKHLGTEHQKLRTAEHGGELTETYLHYTVQDVQATWECFEKLREQYERYGLSDTPVHKIYSEASLGKAYLKQMGIKAWRELQPDFPPEMLGIIMSTYYGGRSEVRIRREVVRVLYCDFLSMYPTVCTLMGLWSFVIAKGMECRDVTAEIRQFLEGVTLENLQEPETWRELPALVRVKPEADILPVRAKYGDEGQYTIGLNYLSGDGEHWYTLADCIASKLLTGKAPQVVEAIRFEPVGVQPGLEPIRIAGNAEYGIDPMRDDLYERLIDLRSEVRSRLKEARRAGDEELAQRLDSEQYALKICANATSYGIFVELNVTEQDQSQDVSVYGASGEAYSVGVRNIEEPGRYFHPLLATLITGAARLMLSIAERLARDEGMGWAFCDTDSMALARPDGMIEEDFLRRAERVREWFTPLNPYQDKGPLFKVEDANYGLKGGKLSSAIAPLHCYAISAKRYALFNIDPKGRPVLRKVSAHGLGHLLAPYQEDKAPREVPKPSVPLSELGVERWQHDVWYRIVQGALGDHPDWVRLDDLPGFKVPAVSRYAATTPNLLRWFRTYNEDKPYREQVRPFGFLLSFQPHPTLAGRSAPRPISAYDSDAGTGARGCFDRETGTPVSAERLKTYREALAQYHLHPEAKFHEGDYLDSGVTVRRHIVPMSTHHIGKEANRWEEQYHLGIEEDAQVEYGTRLDEDIQAVDDVIPAVRGLGITAVARATGLSPRTVSAIVKRKQRPTVDVTMRIARAVGEIQQTKSRQDAKTNATLDIARSVC